MKIVLFLMLFPVLCANAQVSFDSKIVEAVGKLKCPKPDEQHPVTLTAGLVTENDSIAIIVKASLAPGWHIYEYVPPTLPYIPIKPVLQLPGNIRVVGPWKKTEPTTSANDPGVLIYEDEAVFVRKALKLPKAETSGTIRAGLYYQTCDNRQCLPPIEKIFELKY